ncbi:MAG: hypothetical protein ABR978_09200 [Dehalococcoidia bacterium]|jgi:hypothetical protein
MTSDIAGWVVEFRGCTEKDADCHCGQFEVAQEGRPAQQVEVLTTMQIEHILAGEMGKTALTDDERSVILATAGLHLIEHCIQEDGRVPPVLHLTGMIFRSRGAERRLLQECGLL